jgi:hypothetical protein
MAPSTITIKIEFGAEGVSAQSSTVLRGDAAAAELPTPMDGAGAALSSAATADIPTPFSSGFASVSSRSVDAAPSPLDSAHGHQVAEEGSTQSEAPEPQEKKSRK